MPRTFIVSCRSRFIVFSHLNHVGAGDCGLSDRDKVPFLTSALSSEPSEWDGGSAVRGELGRRTHGRRLILSTPGKTGSILERLKSQIGIAVQEALFLSFRSWELAMTSSRKPFDAWQLRDNSTSTLKSLLIIQLSDLENVCGLYVS